MTSPAQTTLALDLASASGWALGNSTSRFRFGTWKLDPNGDDVAGKYAALMEAMGDAVAVHAPDRIIVEAPLPAIRQTNQDNAVLLMGLASTARLFCYWRGIPYFEQNAGSVRRDMLFEYYAKKPKIVAWVRARGYDVVDHNAADAMLLLHHSINPNPNGWPPSGKRA